jgi:hypothetical protein
LIKVRRHYMQEISFSIPVSGTVKFDEGSITITINRMETTISFEPVLPKQERISLEKGRTVFDIVRETAQELIKRTNGNHFSAAQLYSVALEKYPDLKRNSWGSHIIASAGNHPSQRYYGSKRDYFRYLGDGTYSLKETYLGKSNMK